MSAETWTAQIPLILAWLGYAVLHSVTASLALKRWFAARHPDWMPGYRLAFNSIAVIGLLPVAWVFFASRSEPLWAWTGPLWWLMNALALLAVIGFWYSLKFYDGGEFFGTRQWRERNASVEDQENFHISPLHRFVRHPWYSFGLVLVWTRDMDPALLISAIMITLYFAIGSRFEERKLCRYHGAVYEQYRAAVPGLIPRPWRFLSAARAQQLVAQAEQPVDQARR